jgi:hypothetical protein
MTNWTKVPGGGQGGPTRIENAERFMAEVDTFVRGVRRWDWKTAVYDAEVQMAAMKLCEDSEFLACLRAEWSRRVAANGEPVPAELLALLAGNAPDLIAGSFDAVISYVEKDKGELT